MKTDASTARLIDRIVDRARLEKLADWLAAAAVAAMPWSTSISEILIVCWLVAVLPTLDVAMVRREVQSAAGGLPVLLWVLGVLGMVWAADISWAERFAGLKSFHKLLVIPLLLAHFRRSERGWLVLYAFLASCIALLIASVITSFGPFHRPGKLPGIPVRDYIAQSTEFLICLFALLAVAYGQWRAGRGRHAAISAILAGLFLANILLVSTGRTALIVVPLLLLLLGFRFFGWKGMAAAVLASVIIAGVAWFTSPFLRERIHFTMVDAQAYQQSSTEVTSTAARAEMYRKSLRFIAAAPVIGHGTGSIPDQFRRAATGEGLSALAANNPHNQIFAVAIQLGALGTVVLLAMWVAHFLLFRGGGLIPWIGTVIVVQSFVSSLFNTHLFDSFHGWLYVFGVGVVGGLALRGTPLTEAEPP